MKKELYLDKEFSRILNLLESNTNFAISRFGDGEMKIIEKVPLDISIKKEFVYDPKKNEDFRVRLEQSFIQKENNYYVGIPCNCCSNDDMVKKCVNLVRSNITFANIFVNYNYNNFEKILKILSKRKVYLVSSERSSVKDLPFKVEKHFKCSDNVMNDLHIVNQVRDCISKEDITNSVFLFCSGPLANILSYELFKFNNNNTYIDFGSTLDKIFYNKPTRRYHRAGHKNLSKLCKLTF
jgi:hypothetical protein